MNKAFCDINVQTQCKTNNYADPYCSCLKPMTSYDKYKGFDKIYDGLTECYVSDCTLTNAYKLKNVQCPDCLQILGISGTLTVYRYVNLCKNT